MTKKIQRKTIQKFPKPTVLQRAANVVLSGKCNLSHPTYVKLKKHQAIIRRLAAMKGTTATKEAFIRKNKKQVGGFMAMLPLIASAATTILPSLLKSLLIQ